MLDRPICFFAGCLFVVSITFAQPAQPAPPSGGVSARVPAEVSMLGVNLAGGEFGKGRGVFNREYTYPGAKQFDYCKAKGLVVVRLPFKWERLQPVLMQPLDAVELKRLDGVVELARERGIKLLLDVHNYARYDGHVIGTPETPNAAFADFWRRVAEHYKDEAAIFAYGLMNEPHGTGGRWPAAAQAGIDAIRSVDREHTLIVCGDGWSGAHSWKKINDNLILRDPEQRLVYEAHQYFDRDHSGSYRQSYDESGAHPLVGVERLQPFVDWLKEHDARGFIGEFGVPDDDPRWLEALDHFIAAMKANNLAGTYWAAGPWWNNYPLSSEPRDGRDRPQMEVLELYAGARQKPKDAKTSYDDAARKTSPPPPGEKIIHDFGKRKEGYTYSDDASTMRSEAVEADGRAFRRIHFKHEGSPAWTGIGLYFGSLDCRDRTAFSLMVRAKKAAKLEVKAYHADDAKYAASFPVTTEWQELVIPFELLVGKEGAFDAKRRLLKIEFQPSLDHAGSSIDLGKLKLIEQK
jgi:endoglucanase